MSLDFENSVINLIDLFLVFVVIPCETYITYRFHFFSTVLNHFLHFLKSFDLVVLSER